MAVSERDKFFHCFGLFIILFMMCIVPMLSDLYSYNRRSVIVAEENVQYVSVKNTHVTQKLYFQGTVRNVGIAFYAPSGALYEDAQVEITLTQGNKSIQESVSAACLRTKCAYEMNPQTALEYNEKSEMTYVLKGNVHKFSEGEAVLSVYSGNLPDGTDLFCKVSDTVTSGLPSAMADENILGHPLVVSYDVFYKNKHFYYETILLGLLIAVLLGTSVIFTIRKELLQKGAGFLCAGVIIFFTISIRNPYAAFWGEPRSEAAYEFWYKAEHMGLLQSMMCLMSGEALAWMERILMWTANTIAPLKYVFRCAQLMELCWISWVTALPCSIKFRQYFGDVTRLLFSIFIGTALLFDSAYYFWSCSYWGIIFFILFALLPLERLKRPVYIAGLVLTTVLCISRIYYVILIPIAVCILFVFRKKTGMRLRIYCYTVSIACGFEAVYSLLSADSLTGNTNLIEGLLEIGLPRLILNTLYYQVQVLNSFFFGNAHWQGSGTNLLFLILFFSAVVWFVCLIKNNHRVMACYVGSLGFISISTIAVNVYVSGTHAAVSFPKNYAAAVDWMENYYQKADLHFSFAYVCLAFLCLAAVYMCRNYVEYHFYTQVTRGMVKKVQKISAALFAFCTIAVISVHMKPRLSYEDREIIVEWDSLYKVVNEEAYFIAVNVFYEAAPISLEHHADEMIFGLKKDGSLYLWESGKERYEMEQPYSEAAIGEVSEIENESILSVTAKSAITNFNVPYAAVFKDKDGKELARVMQAEQEYRLWRTYLLPEPLKNVYSISFELEDGSTAYVENALQIGYVVQ